ncbi:MAG: YihY/virulence factor BrkB family protein, partial [Candidatus Hydrogenedentes bacterium]|nr:YihY/virulence factor BrkB family protein [Candidatus Hydrogenedentota bacterium]
MLQYLQRMAAAAERGHRFVTHDVWHIGRPGEEVPHGLIIKHVRVAILIVRGLIEETLLLRASALTFATLLFTVPFLTFMFYFITTFNLGEAVYRRWSELIDERLTQVALMIRGDGGKKEPPPDVLTAHVPRKVDLKGLAGFPDAPSYLTPNTRPPVRVTKVQALSAASTVRSAGRGRDRDRDNETLKRSITSFFLLGVAQAGGSTQSQYVDPVKMLVTMAEQGARDLPTLGLSGLVFVLTTVFGLMRNVETSVNAIWGVTRNRNWFRVLGDYLMITLLLPFVAAGVLAITAALESRAIQEALGPFVTGLRGAQLAVICGTMSLLNWLVPNTQVRKRYALLGGVVAGGLWVVNSWAYVKFQIGLARYTPFFSGFALFPILMMWVYASWIILLLGALITFAYQNEKTFAMERYSDVAAFAYREALAVRVVVEMARRFRDGLPGYTVAEMAENWNVPMRLLHETLDCLVAARLVIRCATEPPAYQPARSPETTYARDVVRAVREAGESPSLLRQDGVYASVYEALDAGDPRCLNATISELAQRVETQT